MGDKGDTIFSAVGQRLQAWNALDGKLAWETQETGNVRALEVVPDLNGRYDVLASVGGDGSATILVERYAGDTGDVIWSQQIR